MTQSVRIRRDGDQIAIEATEDTRDHRGVLSTSYVSAEAAVELFTAGLALAHQILRERGART